MGGGAVVEYGSEKLVPEKELLLSSEKRSSREWTLGHTPRFEVALNGETLRVEKGRVINRPGRELFKDLRGATECV